MEGMSSALQTPRPSLGELSEEEELFRQSVATFAEVQIRPHVAAMDAEGKFRPDLCQRFFELGLMGIEIPEAMGGAGSSFFMSILAVEELSRIDASAGVIVDVQNTLVNNAILRWGSEELKQRYLPRLASEWIGAYALSEATSGSDAFGLQTRAEVSGDRFRLNGHKLWTTNASEASLFLIFANAAPEKGYKGITAFLVERDSRGLRSGKRRINWA